MIHAVQHISPDTVNTRLSKNSAARATLLLHFSARAEKPTCDHQLRIAVRSAIIFEPRQSRPTLPVRSTETWTTEVMAGKKKQKSDEPEAEKTTSGAGSDAVEEAIEKSESLAQSQLEMARLFVSHGKVEIARRRLIDVISNYGRSDAAKEARKLLRQIGR